MYKEIIEYKQCEQCKMCKDSILKAHNMGTRKVTCITLHTRDTREGGRKRRVGKTNRNNYGINGRIILKWIIRK
jgi:hypothetical protein